MEEIDRELHRNLKSIIDNKEDNLEELLGINFVVTVDEWGKKSEIALIVPF